MSFQHTYIPYGVYWSTPFCRWQGALGRIHSLELAARTTSRFLERGSISAEELDGLVLGITVPQRHSFYGAPWLAGMIGAPGITGTTVSQACATSARALLSAALEVERGLKGCMLAVACDRTSNGPHIYYPDPGGIGGMGETEDPVWDNFNKDPHAGAAMIQTAENVAREAGISREEQDDMALLRSRQYQDALEDDRAFQRRYFAAVELPKGRKETQVIDEDEGVFPTTKEGLAKLRPVLDGGSVTFGTQTYPADGNAGIVICSRERAEALRKDKSVSIQVLGFGDARVKKGHMPMAVVPAARMALNAAGITLEECAASQTHNPFAGYHLYVSREPAVRPERMNRFGSPLVWGHPQAPTGLRLIVELIEELVVAGGGHGLFSGCAAGDTAMAMVLKVS
ncbi:MAG: thiolase family protein [Planctomycetota bacterium]